MVSKMRPIQLGPVMSRLHLEIQGFKKHKENAGDAEHSGAQQRRGGREEGYGRLSIATLVLWTRDPLPLRISTAESLCLVRSANYCVLQWWAPSDNTTTPDAQARAPHCHAGHNEYDAPSATYTVLNRYVVSPSRSPPVPREAAVRRRLLQCTTRPLDPHAPTSVPLLNSATNVCMTPSVVACAVDLAAPLTQTSACNGSDSGAAKMQCLG
jgi:hypothetical protein